jgi:hypothetical protein
LENQSISFSLQQIPTPTSDIGGSGRISAEQYHQQGISPPITTSSSTVASSGFPQTTSATPFGTLLTAVQAEQQQFRQRIGNSRNLSDEVNFPQQLTPNTTTNGIPQSMLQSVTAAQALVTLAQQQVAQIRHHVGTTTTSSSLGTSPPVTAFGSSGTLVMGGGIPQAASSTNDENAATVAALTALLSGAIEPALTAQLLNLSPQVSKKEEK